MAKNKKSKSIFEPNIEVLVKVLLVLLKKESNSFQFCNKNMFCSQVYTTPYNKQNSNMSNTTN